MTLIYSFLFCGFVCLIAQIILDNSKLTPGHITSIYVVSGAFLGFLGVYDKIVEFVGAGANVPILSFGNTLLSFAVEGFEKSGLLGIFDNILVGVSVGISSAIIFSFILTIFTKVRD